METIAGIEFTKFIDVQWNREWKQHEISCQEKISRLKEKQVKKLEKYVHKEVYPDKKPETGLDKLIINMKYKDEDIAQIEYDNKPINLGSASIKGNKEKICSKPPDYTLYEKVTERNEELHMEVSLAKGRWSEVEQNKNNENNESLAPTRNVYNSASKTINFQSVRATDLKSNKRVNIVENCDVQQEAKI